MVSVRNLTKRYDSKLAVDNLSFEVATGHVTGFLGPNGAGKSTTMRLMLGLANGEGETTFDGKRLHEYGQTSKVVGFLDLNLGHPWYCCSHERAAQYSPKTHLQRPVAF